MNRGAAGLILLLAPILLSGCVTAQPSAHAPAVPATAISFESKTAAIRFSYPRSWHPIKDKAVLSLVPSGETKMALNTLVIQKPDLPPHIPGFIPLVLVERGFVDDLKKRYKDIVVSLSAARTVDGASAREVHAAGKRDAGDVFIVALLCVHGDAVYIVNAQTTAAQAASAQAAWDTVVNSMQWMQ